MFITVGDRYLQKYFVFMKCPLIYSQKCKLFIIKVISKFCIVSFGLSYLSNPTFVNFYKHAKICCNDTMYYVLDIDDYYLQQYHENIFFSLKDSNRNSNLFCSKSDYMLL